MPAATSLPVRVNNIKNHNRKYYTGYDKLAFI